MIDLLIAYWGHVLMAVAFILVGIGSAHVDALSDYRQETVYADWADRGGLLGTIGSFMVMGPGKSRQWIPNSWPSIPTGMARAISDGWHVSKLVMLGASLFLIAALVAGRYNMRLVDSWWIEALIIIIGGYACIGGTFGIFYHHLLRC